MEQLILPQLVNCGVFDAAVRYPDRTETPLRKVSLFEIELPLAAGGTSYVNGEKYPICHNRMICAKPGFQRFTRLPFRCYFLHLMVEPGPFYDWLTAVEDVFEVEDVETYRTLFTEIIDAYFFPYEGSDLYVADRLLTLLQLLYQQHKKEKSSSRWEKDFVTQAIQYMDEHFAENPDLQQIAAAVNISPIYFQKAFTKAAGRSPYRYLLSRKLELAKKLLLTTTLSLADIALKCGFSSQSYFGYVFRRELGMTPLAYRKSVHSNYVG